MGLIALLASCVIGIFNEQRPRRAEPREVAQARIDLIPVVQPMPTVPTPEVSQTSDNNVGTGDEAIVEEVHDNQADLPTPVPVRQAARIIGDLVRVRAQPNLEADIISRVNRDDVLEIISFDNGWYQVALADEGSGYIFGAYLMPEDADSYPYQAAVIKAGEIKILIRDAGRPKYFLSLWPDGETTWVLKEDVETY